MSFVEREITGVSPTITGITDGEAVSITSRENPQLPYSYGTCEDYVKFLLKHYSPYWHRDSRVWGNSPTTHRAILYSIIRLFELGRRVLATLPRSRSVVVKH